MKILQRIFLIGFVGFIGIAKAKHQLLFATVIFRHGDRTPISFFPTDPNKNYSMFVELGPGQLTKRGKLQHYELGKWLRKRYSEILPESYNYRSIYVQSTDTDRTIMSADSNMAGLFRPNQNEIWNNEIKDWQPIPIHVVPEEYDNVLAGNAPCPKYEMELKKLKESPLFQYYDKINEPLYKLVSQKTGSKINSILQLNNLYDNLLIEKTYNLTLPEWTIPIYKELEEWATFSFQIQCFTPILQRYKVGLLHNEIIERMEAKALNKLEPNRNLWIYSGHDITIANLLSSWNLFNHKPPPYTSTILIELLKDENNQIGVSLFLKNETDKIYPLILPTCSEFCNLDQYKNILKDIILSKNQWENECQLDILTRFQSYQHNMSHNQNLVVIVAASSILMLIGSLLAFLFYRKSEPNPLYLRLENDER